MTWRHLKSRLSVERGVIALLIFYLALTLIQCDRATDIQNVAARNWALVFMVVRLAIVFVIAGIAVSTVSTNHGGQK